MSKYANLYEHLKKSDKNSVKMSFADIEKLIGFTLPESAYKYRAWWSPSKTHTAASGWERLGWKASVNMETEAVSFFRKNELDDYRSFWWVNSGASHKSQISGGYISCPIVRENDTQRPTWINIKYVKKNDVIFSYVQQEIKAIGIAQTDCYEANIPEEYKEIYGERWEVPVEWFELENSFKPKDFIEQILPLLPEKNSPLRTHSDDPSKIGNGNQVYLCSISPALASLLYKLAYHEDADVIEEIAASEIEKENIPNTEKESLIKSRLGQGKFRAELLKIEPKCRVTGISDERFLLASHIKPWAVASNFERLDPNNGLMLAPHIDALFDKGLISFSDDGKMLIKDQSIENVLSSWGVDYKKKFGRFTQEQANYLEYHRRELFDLN
ncbi:MAG: HNH endonuclease signature motif containing protein [Advenella sp.]|nr:HNH endonuclease signature motif containing protein [Advenella sp.]